MRGAYVKVIEGAEKQAGRLWDKFGMKEVAKEKCDTLYVGVGHHHSQRNGMCFVTRRKACVLWKLEGDLSVSEGEIPSEFEWWDTTCAQADLLHSERRRARTRV